MIHHLVQLAYLIATALFVFALHWMNAPTTARMPSMATAQPNRSPVAGAGFVKVSMGILGVGLVRS